MSKQQLIEAIRKHNHSATQDFLMGFNEDALNNYLNHLEYRRRPRNSNSRWIRPGETPAVVMRARR